MNTGGGVLTPTPLLTLSDGHQNMYGWQAGGTHPTGMFSCIVRCEYDFVVLWTRELGHSPFAAAPLIADINADGRLDVIAAPFLDEVSVLQGEDGTTLRGSTWPYPFVDISTHSSPLMVNISHFVYYLMVTGFA